MLRNQGIALSNCNTGAARRLALTAFSLLLLQCTTETGAVQQHDAEQSLPQKEKLTLVPASRTTSSPSVLIKQMSLSQDLVQLPTSPVAGNLRLVWISLDGLQRSMLEGFLARKAQTSEGLASLHPKGIRYLLGQSAAWSDLQITDPTITASSHTSTMTCLPPGVHGIVANSQWNGKSNESGFDKIHDSDTFVGALRSSGLRVAVVGYPGFDGRAPNRNADLSISYARGKGKSQVVPVSPGRDVTLDLSAFQPQNSAPNPGSAGPSPLGEVSFSLDPSRTRGTIWRTQADGARLRVGVIGSNSWSEILVDMPAATTPSGSTPGGGSRKARQLMLARVFQRPVKDAAAATAPETTTPAQETVLYLSQATTNSVQPDTLASALDERGLIFPAGKDFFALKELGDSGFLATMESNLRYFGLNAHEALGDPDIDAAFLYFESLDVLGHQYAGAPDKIPAVDTHLAVFDQMLGSLLARLGPRTNLVVAGDHGMSAIQFELSALELIPEAARGQVQVRSSGGTLFIYGPDEASLTTLPPADKAWFQELVTTLRQVTVPGKAAERILTKVWVKGSPEAEAQQWLPSTPMPWIIATAASGIGLVTTVEPGLLQSLRRGAAVPPEMLARAARPMDPVTGQPREGLPEPVPLGQHGHASTERDMLTHVILMGPQVGGLSKALRTRQARQAARPKLLRNTELVPLVADRMGWPRPQGCAAASTQP